MNTSLRITLLFVFVSLVLPIHVSAQESGGTINVPVATGVGRDSAEALKNALRAAVEQAVGSMVDSETLIENEEVVSDKILSFSGGFVQTYRQLGEPRVMDGGLVSVRISAEVKRNELGTQLRNAGVIKVSVDGRSLAAQVISKEMSREDGIEMLVNMLEKFPASVCDTSAEWRYDLETRRVIIEVKTKIDQRKYETFVKEFTDLLRKVGAERASGSGNTRIRSTGTPTASVSLTTDEIVPRGGTPAFPNVAGTDLFLLAITDRWGNFTRAGQEASVQFSSYYVPRDVWGMIRPMFLSRRMVVEAVDGNNRVLATGSATAPALSCQLGNYRNFIFIFPALNVTDRDWFVNDITPGMSEYKQQVPLNISRDDIERISAVRISME